MDTLRAWLHLCDLARGPALGATTEEAEEGGEGKDEERGARGAASGADRRRPPALVVPVSLPTTLSGGLSGVVPGGGSGGGEGPATSVSPGADPGATPGSAQLRSWADVLTRLHSSAGGGQGAEQAHRQRPLPAAALAPPQQLAATSVARLNPVWDGGASDAMSVAETAVGAACAGQQSA